LNVLSGRSVGNGCVSSVTDSNKISKVRRLAGDIAAVIHNPIAYLLSAAAGANLM